MTEVGDHQSLVASLKQAAYFHLFKVVLPSLVATGTTNHSRCCGSRYCKDIGLCQDDVLATSHGDFGQQPAGGIIRKGKWVDMSCLLHGLWFSWTLKLAPTWQSQLS